MMDWQIIRFLFTCFVLILSPIYWRYYGVQNFLWISDIGLFLTLIALWANSGFLMSIAALEAFALEIAWSIDFLSILIFRKSVIKLADYMYDPIYPAGLRLLSLFHIFMPIIWVLYLNEFGYSSSALFYAILIFELILFLSYFFTDISKNINWVFLPKIYNLKISQITWLALLAIGVPLFVFLPTHYLFLVVFNEVY